MPRQDMQEIQRRHQFSFVKLIISFKRGLHPFYPPSVEVGIRHLSLGTLSSEEGPLAGHPTPIIGLTFIYAPKLHITNFL